MKTSPILGSAATALALLLTACGGGGGIGGTGGGGGGGIGGTGVAYGAISGFGSVIVNGVAYSSSGTEIKIDDRGGLSQNDLRVGMTVRVDGSITNKQATTITARSALKGRVEQLIDANQMTVMGQTVRVDDLTVFENNIRPVVGEYVEVHGLPAAHGVIAAGYVERKSTPALPEFVATGTVQGHDAAASTFRVGNLTVAYAGATATDMPSGSWNGLLVEAKGATCAGNPACTTLSASKVEPAGLRVTTATEAEVEGFVTSGNSSSFTLANQAVTTSASTVFEGGVAADLAVGVKLEAEGPIVAGVLTATKVKFKDGVRVESNVAIVSSNTITMEGLPGLSVQINSLTELKNLSSLAVLAPTNHVRIRGRLGARGAIIATELELRSTSPDKRLELRGPVQAFADPSLTILGIAINTSTVPDAQFKGLDDQVIGRTAFFNALVVGNPVEAKGEVNAGVARWDEVELED